jgi:hypothetical protein
MRTTGEKLITAPFHFEKRQRTESFNGMCVSCEIGEYQRLRPELLRFNSFMMTNKINKVKIFSVGIKACGNFKLDKKKN